MNNNTPHLKTPKNQKRGAALGRPAMQLLGGGCGGRVSTSLCVSFFPFWYTGWDMILLIPDYCFSAFLLFKDTLIPISTLFAIYIKCHCF